MKFWDSSVLVPLILDEPSTDEMHAILRADRNIVVSFITPLEVESAIWRRVRHARDNEARGLHLPFVTLDEELVAAARSEGFPVLP